MGKSFCICKDGTCKRRTGAAYGESAAAVGIPAPTRCIAARSETAGPVKSCCTGAFAAQVSASVRMGSATARPAWCEITTPPPSAIRHGRRPGHHRAGMPSMVTANSGATVCCCSRVSVRQACLHGKDKRNVGVCFGVCHDVKQNGAERATSAQAR